MKYIFFGGKAIGNYVLNGLIDSNNIPSGIVVYKDIIEKTILSKAKSRGVEVLRVEKFKAEGNLIIEFIKKIKADVIISVAFPFILQKEILELVEKPINIHTGAIPKYRGHHPLSAALLNDEPYQATTVHYMTEEVDAGDVLLQDYVPVENEDTIITVRQKLIELSLKLILTVIDQLKQGTLYPKKQIGESIWAPMRKPEDSRIFFSNKSRYLHNFIRALVDPYPNAFAYRQDKKLVKIKKSFISNTPGKVLEDLGDNKYIVSTEDGVIMIETDIKLEIGEQLQ